MKALSLRFLLLSFFAAAVCMSGVRAQLPPNGIDFKTSSSFVAQNVTLPAGSYNIRPMQDDMETLILSSSDGHSALIPCEALESSGPSKTEITFHRYGKTLYLNQVWSAGNSTGCLIQAGPAEKKERKSGKPTQETVAATSK